MSNTVDEESRRSVDTRTSATRQIILNAFRIRALLEIMDITSDIQMQVLCRLRQEIGRYRVLILKEVVMHVPKPVLCSRSFGRKFGVGMNANQRKMAIYKSQIIPER